MLFDRSINDMGRFDFVRTLGLVILLLLCFQPSSAQERLCDPSWENCFSPLIQLVNDETTGIDMHFYMIELPELADALIARHRAGVPVRILLRKPKNPYD